MLPHKKILSIPRYFNRAHSLAIRLSLAFALAIGLVVQPQLAIAEKTETTQKLKSAPKSTATKASTAPQKPKAQKTKAKNASPAKPQPKPQTLEIKKTERPSIRPVIPAALLGLSLVSGVTVAASQSNTITVAQTGQHDGDDRLIQLREAFLRNDQVEFQRIFSQSDQAPLKEHPLYPYVQHWTLRLKLSQRPIAEANADALQREVLRFLARHDGESLGEQLRKTYIEWLADRESWAQLQLEYPKLIFQDEAPLQCHFHFARLKLASGEQETLMLIASQSKQLLFAPRPLGAACGRLFSELKQQGQIDQSALQHRLRLALETNQAAAIRWAASHLGLPSSEVERALDQPEKALRSSNPAVGQIAWTRFARQDSIEAYRRWRQNEQKSWPVSVRSFITAQIASMSMLRMQAQAIEVTRDALRESQAMGASAIEQGVLGSDESLAIMARSSLRAQDWDSLQQIIAWMSPRGQADPTWQYWRARAYRQAGDEQAAQTLFKELAGQFHFYGQLSLEELGLSIELPPRAAAPTKDELRAVAALAGVQRAFKLYQLGLRAEAHREWWVSTKTMSDRELLAAAELACRRLVLDRCVNTADRTKLEHDFHLRFIMPFREDLEASANRVGLDSAWAYGLIRQESRFLLDAKSSVGAQGLMQIMPTTGRWIAKKLGHGDFKTEDLHDMKTNIRFGTFYLRSVFDDLDGSQAMASAAYNAGPNRPRAWRASLPGPIEGAIFAEIIPFTETRDYVKKVLSNAVYYAAIQKQGSQSLKKRLGEITPKAAGNSLLP